MALGLFSFDLDVQHMMVNPKFFFFILISKRKKKAHYGGTIVHRVRVVGPCIRNVQQLNRSK